MELEHHSVNAEFERQTDIKYIYSSHHNIVSGFLICTRSLRADQYCACATHNRDTKECVFDYECETKEKKKQRQIPLIFSLKAAIVAGNHRLFNRLKKIQAMLYIN